MEKSRVRIGHLSLLLFLAGTISSGSDSAKSHYEAGLCYAQDYRPIEAVAEFQIALRSEPTNRKYLQALEQQKPRAVYLLVNAAKLLRSVQRHREADELLRKAAEIDPREAPFINNEIQKYAGVFSVPPRSGPGEVNNADVVEMLKLGLDQEVILTKIRRSVNRFDTSIEALGALKQAGASKDLILAVMSSQPIARAPDMPGLDLKSVRYLFVDEMPYNLDRYIRAEITKRLKGRIVVTLDPRQADAAMVGIADGTDNPGERILDRWLWLRDTSTAAISIVDRENKFVVWSSEAGDRSWFWWILRRDGPRKVAARLTKNLKAALD